jgi:CheY-like chemotaxis protein
MRTIMVSGQKFHVLVVDSGEGMAATTTAMLERLGYTAEGETSSLEGLRTFSKDPDKFDIAIVDPAMSGQGRPELSALGSMRRGSPVTRELTGIELAVRLRRIKQGFPVVLYTEYIKPPLAEEIKAAGFGEAIPKPVGLKELDKAVIEGLHPYSPRVH